MKKWSYTYKCAHVRVDNILHLGSIWTWSPGAAVLHVTDGRVFWKILLSLVDARCTCIGTTHSSRFIVTGVSHVRPPPPLMSSFIPLH